MLFRQPGRPRRRAVRDPQVPHDGRRRRGTPRRRSTADNERSGPLFKMEQRSADHADRPLPAGDQPRRAAPVVQRARRHDEPRRPAAGAAAARSPSSRRSSMPATRCVRASPACGRSRPATTRRSRRTVRLDLFYVQNWSLPLDLLIMLGTVDHIVLRPLIKLLYRGEDERRRAAAAVGATATQRCCSVG